nr:MAG TPA: hypothetical protein [Caudoviricetes sp.]DAQ80143.1 MAG TPA: hypothetical protein [Caudoviricetes sp.]
MKKLNCKTISYTVFSFCPDYAEDVKSCIVSSPDVKREYRVMA